ncbi:hypothetical protein [Paraburkholderia fungorum]|uniref:Uncharacterized protein n=1 Tax=Paraburkholderia fungorum TaxID=134537 RepID=A0AAW3V0Z8_9BURK|nr:hypothetical protein [Paraburkholderia fungorum]MBB4517255.1 hypothetical protein [Paraburkholderia fungorum]MBB6204323.1 hypothetical protein [Paraburkholderia fungorum]
MKHVLHNLRPRGVARRLALGRWDYSTEHILGLQFTINFLGQGFGLKEAPANFLSTRRWLLTRETPQRFSQAVEILAGADGLRASGYATYPGGWFGQVYEKDLNVPDEDLGTSKMSGDNNARLLLDRMQAHIEAVVTSSGR